MKEDLADFKGFDSLLSFNKLNLFLDGLKVLKIINGD